MSDTPPLCAAPDPSPRAPQVTVPDGATDCHFHIFDRPSPQIAERSYTAPPAPLDAFQHLHATLRISRSVIVQPSVYGTDNRTTLAACDSTPQMRAIVVVDEDTPPSTLAAYRKRAAVGCRVNMLFGSNARIDSLCSLARRIADQGWHLQILGDVSALGDRMDEFASLPVPVVFDHFGHLQAIRGINDPGFRRLLRLLGSGAAWVKLSGAYRLGPAGAQTDRAVADLAAALIAANPDQLVWGSDWPHPAIPQQDMPNDGDLLDALAGWAPDAALRRRILVDNPARLYGFDAA
jgi:predicted TIM-barrel fold metal-dependent hydrolase